MKNYADCTCHLKPMKNVTFGDREMVLCFTQHFMSDEILSIAQLLGDRRGVIRITFRNKQCVKKLEDLLVRKKLLVQSTHLGLCDMDGQFIIVLLENVPSCVPDLEVEETMGKYGLVSSSLREYYDFKGVKIENERRKIMYALLFQHVAIPSKIRMGEAVVFCRVLGAGTLNHEPGSPSERDRESSPGPPSLRHRTLSQENLVDGPRKLTHNR